MSPARATFVLLIFVFAIPKAALGDEPTTQQLKEQLVQLRARLDALEKKQTASDADVAATVQQIVKDAESRSKLLATGGDVTAGYANGFFIRSADGNLTLKPGVLMQFRNVTNVLTGGGGEDESAENGFEIRRLRPRFDGNLFSPDFTFSFILDTSRNTGNMSLLDAWVQYRLAPHWAVKAGQFRSSWVHEGDTPDANQLAAERSLVDALLAGSQTDRVQGVALINGGVADTPWRFELAYHDGDNTKNTTWQDTNANFGTSARAEYKFSGNWPDYKDFSAHTTKQQLLVVGAGVDWSEFGGSDVVRTTADVQLETASHWTWYGEVNGNINRSDGEETFDWGGLAQVGYNFSPAWEPFIRYAVVVIDDAGQTGYSEVTMGINYFLGENGSAGHRGKFTLDLLYLPDGSPQDITGEGILASDRAEFVLRGQFQLFL